MEIIRTAREMQAWARTRRAAGQTICVVPTMGYLHAGHVSLLEQGRPLADAMVMTLFVNPTQFGPNEDLARYPRDEAGDLAKARAAGAAAVFAPEVPSMYAPGYQTYVQVRDLEQPLCGSGRPGHFVGVASVVAKLFHITMANVAVFGEKDYQQLAIIRRMVRDLDFDIEIKTGPIVRESDGLAMSSRNAYLGPDERAQAPAIQRGLSAARSAHAAGERSARALEAAARAVIAAAPLARIEYLELRDAAELVPVETLTSPGVLAAAVHFGKTRLIDNMVLA